MICCHLNGSINVTLWFDLMRNDFSNDLVTNHTVAFHRFEFLGTIKET